MAEEKSTQFCLINELFTFGPIIYLTPCIQLFYKHAIKNKKLKSYQNLYGIVNKIRKRNYFISSMIGSNGEPDESVEFMARVTGDPD
jgi:hypothetical protein